MSSKRSSYYIESHGPSSTAIGAGLAWLNQSGSKSTLVAVNGLAVLDSLTPVTSDAFVKTLKKDKSARLNTNLVVSLLTEKETRYSWDGPLLALYPSPKLLDKIDGITGVTSVLVVPWLATEVEPWIKTWSALPLGSTQNVKAPSYDMDRVLISALRNLTERVNLSTGIGHPLDRSAAIWMFRILRNGGVKYDPAAVKAWLMSEGKWTPAGANAVQKVAADILAGKGLHAGQQAWAADILKQWKGEALEDEKE